VKLDVRGTGAFLDSLTVDGSPVLTSVSGAASLSSSQTFSGANTFASTAAFTALNGSVAGVTISSGLVVSAGNVGIGTTAPQGRLDVTAGGNAATDMAQIWRNSSGDMVSTMSATGIITAKTFVGKFVGDGSGLTVSAGKFATDDNSSTPGDIYLSTSVFGKTYVYSGSGDAVYHLPSVAGDHIGAQFIFVKLGTGKVTIQGADSDHIADGIKIYNSSYAPAFAAITLRLVTADRWMIFYGDGAWVTESE